MAFVIFCDTNIQPATNLFPGCCVLDNTNLLARDRLVSFKFVFLYEIACCASVSQSVVQYIFGHVRQSSNGDVHRIMKATQGIFFQVSLNVLTEQQSVK